jgi:hypothetical protein
VLYRRLSHDGYQFLDVMLKYGADPHYDWARPVTFGKDGAMHHELEAVTEHAIRKT